MHRGRRALATHVERAATSYCFKGIIAVRNALAGERRVAIRQMEMQMRFGRVATVSQQPDHLTAAHFLAEFHAQRTGLQVCIESVTTTAQVNNQVVAAHGFQRDRHGARRRPRNVLRNTVLGCDHDTISNGEDFATIGEVALIIQPVAAEGAVVLVNFHIINGETLRDGRHAIDRN